VDRGVVSHPPSGRQATFGELAAKAATLTPPAEVILKDPKDFKLVGKVVRRVDGSAKTDGSAKFTADFSVPGMLTALIARPPRFGATVKSIDAIGTRRVKGVTHVVQVPSGVAVVATSFWAARKGRAALRVTWDESRAERRGSDDLFAAYRALAGGPGRPARREGDAAGALRRAATVIEAIYEFPYLAHAPMEPLDAVVRVGADGCDYWAGSQVQTIDQAVIARTLGLPLDKVRIHTLLAGGSFGRRGTPDGDVAGEGGVDEHVHHIHREGDLRERGVALRAVHRLRLGVHGHHLLADALQLLCHAVSGSFGVVGQADHGPDVSGVGEDVPYCRVIAIDRHAGIIAPRRERRRSGTARGPNPAVRGRCRVKVHRRLMRSACQRRSVPGVTNTGDG